MILRFISYHSLNQQDYFILSTQVTDTIDAAVVYWIRVGLSRGLEVQSQH